MTLYVDDWRQAARVGQVTARWSHLTVGPDGDPAELHAFAAAIGLRRAWFQDKPWPHAHYDVTDSKRRQAIAAGAVPVTWREAARQRLTALQPPRAAAQGGGGARHCRCSGCSAAAAGEAPCHLTPRAPADRKGGVSQ